MGEVTSGDLYSLWKIAHVALPNVAAIYGEASSSLNGAQEGMADSFQSGEGPHGPAHSPIYGSLSQLYNEFQHILALTGRNISDTATAVDKALESFKEQDSTAAGEFDAALKGEEIDGTQLHDPDDPTMNPPEDPQDVQEPEYYDSPGDEAAEDPDQERQNMDDAREDVQEVEIDPDEEE